jgi:hypothetical protein
MRKISVTGQALDIRSEHLMGMQSDLFNHYNAFVKGVSSLASYSRILQVNNITYIDGTISVSSGFAHIQGKNCTVSDQVITAGIGQDEFTAYLELTETIDNDYDYVDYQDNQIINACTRYTAVLKSINSTLNGDALENQNKIIVYTRGFWTDISDQAICDWFKNYYIIANVIRRQQIIDSRQLGMLSYINNKTNKNTLYLDKFGLPSYTANTDIVFTAANFPINPSQFDILEARLTFYKDDNSLFFVAPFNIYFGDVNGYVRNFVVRYGSNITNLGGENALCARLAIDYLDY